MIYSENQVNQICEIDSFKYYPPICNTYAIWPVAKTIHVCAFQLQKSHR